MARGGAATVSKRRAMLQMERITGAMKFAKVGESLTGGTVG